MSKATESEPDGDPGTRSTTMSRQWLILLATLVLFGIWPIANLAFGLGCYVAALIIVNLAAIWGVKIWPANLTLAQSRILVALIAIVPLAVIVRNVPAMFDGTKYKAAWTPISDRLRLEQTPSIAPPIVRTDQPTRFYVFAPGGREVQWQCNSKEDPIAAIDLGFGLYQVDYDPRRDGLPEKSSGKFSALIIIDGSAHHRTMTAVTPYAHPRWFSSLPERGIGATVSEETDELIMVVANGQSRRVPVGDGPTDCVLFNGGSQIAVVHRWTGEMWIINANNAAVQAKIPTFMGQVRIALSPDGERLAIAVDGPQTGIALVSLPDFEVAPLYRLEPAPDWLCFGENSSTIVFTSRRNRSLYRFVRQEETNEWKLNTPGKVLARPVVTLRRGPSGKHVYAAVSAAREQDLSATHYMEHCVLEIRVEDLETTRTFVTERRTIRQTIPGEIDSGVTPMGIDFLGADTMVVACTGTSDIRFFPLNEKGLDKHIFLDTYGALLPHGVANLGQGVISVSAPTLGRIVNLDMKSGGALAIDLAPTDEQLLARDEYALLRRQGERTFREATRAGFSCESCHLEADTDYAQHHIRGPNREMFFTLSVRGLAGTSPYMRNGYHPTLASFHINNEELFRGFAAEVPWDRFAATSAYLEGLPPAHRAWPESETQLADKRLGIVAFEQARCVVCHAFPAFTNLGLHSQETIFPEIRKKRGYPDKIDTPSLLGRGSNPALLHDGRATSIREVLVDQNPSHRHGDVEALDTKSLDALIRFLENL